MKQTRAIYLGVTVMMLAAMMVGGQEGAWFRHKQMYAVPAPGAVVIDGKLDDWDLSGAIEVYVAEATKETRRGRFAVMYDSQALYLGALVHDRTPMMNRHDPQVEPDLGWDGDAAQFRLCIDPSQGYPVNDATWLKEHNETLVALTLWYYTARQEPELQMFLGMGYKSPPDFGKQGVVPRDNFEAQYRGAEDGKGYSFEYRIPWTTLGAKRPLKGGDTVAASMQLHWGRPDNEHIAINGVVYDLGLPGGFPYQNAAVWGKLIFSSTGGLPAELVGGAPPPEPPTPLRFEGHLPEDGEVTIQLLNDHNEVVRVIAGQVPRVAGPLVEEWDGLDGSGKPLPAGKYVWKGLYHQPIRTGHVLSVNNSGQPPWKTDDGKGGWGGDHGAPCGSCVMGDDIILSWTYAEAGSGLIRVDADGRKQRGSLRSANHVACDGERLYLSTDYFSEDWETGRAMFFSKGIELMNASDFCPLAFGNGSKVLPPPPGGEGENNIASGLAVSGGWLFASYKKRSLVARYDARQGDLKETWNIPTPGAMAARQDDILILSDSKLARLKDGQLTVLATDHLDEPAGVAVDRDGLIYVSNQGKLQNVSVFSKEGKYLRSIGKAGGRPAVGRYDPSGMLSPRSLSIDTKGKLWVTENAESPRRVSVWNCESGRLEKEFFGAASYSSFVWMDPEHSDEIYCDGVLWKADLNTGAWSPWSTLWHPKDPNSPGRIMAYPGGLRVFTAKNGRQYAWGSDIHHGTVLFIREGDSLKPLMMFFWTYATPERGRIAGYPLTDDVKEYPSQATFIWVDRNDDQIMQKEEIVAAAALSPEGAKRYFRGFSFVDRDLNLWHAKGAVNRPLRIGSDGRPEYDFAKPDPAPSSIGWKNADGSFYSLAGTFAHQIGEAGKADAMGYGKWSVDGKLDWGIKGYIEWPKALSLPSQRPGSLWGPTTILGTAGEFTGFNTYFGVAHLYTTDGLFVAKVFQDLRESGDELGPNVISCENMNGRLVKPKGMDRYFLLAGDQDGRVTEVLGLNTVKRLAGGDYVITEQDAQRVSAAFAEYQAALARQQGQLVISCGREALETSPAVGKTLDSGRAFEARMAYDETNLYVAYKVTSAAELINGIPDPSLVFKGGNLMDLQLATDPQADPKRKAPASGDVRILVSRQNGKPYAVIFRPKVAGFQGSPTVLKSPTGQESFDSIEICQRVGLDYQTGGRAGSFKALVTIPLNEIGWKPQSGQTIKLDLGYIFGNREGTKALVRSYWHCASFNAGVLNDVPCESRLEPSEWGEARVE